MPKFSADKTAIREKWVIEAFKKDPRISGPKMAKMIKKELKASMRTVRVYELRDQVLKELGWTKSEGRPVPPNGTFLEQAHRTGEGIENAPALSGNPLEGRCVIPVADTNEGIHTQRVLAFMNEKGFFTPKVKVEAITDRYVIIARES
jgi:hypothetical protein